MYFLSSKTPLTHPPIVLLVYLVPLSCNPILSTTSQSTDRSNVLQSSYVSVIRDSNDATITVPACAISDVSRELTSEGVSVLDTGLTGRYHTPGHQEVPHKILQGCQRHGSIYFGEQHLVRSNTDGEILAQDDATQGLLRDMLIQRSNWHLVISEAMIRLHKVESENQGTTPFVLAFGTDAIPISISRKVKVLKTSSLSSNSAKPGAAPLAEESQPNHHAKRHNYPDNAVAVVGMSCKFPGANSPDEFWQLLTKGTAMVQEVPLDRWPATVSDRGNSAKGRFWGNFMEGVDMFDHRFFKKSSREASSMDPQQRLLLQGAYEAMESAEYFSSMNGPPHQRTRDVGCYLGLCSTDYDANVASYAPNAFSTLGTLRAFLSGKISHFFGWSGPSLTLDTACSSSAVAIHTACRALQTGECILALAGGIALFTHPYLYENLSAAHFLSPTGATKPFDAEADGYCRGEGVGLVVLKTLSAAVADGNRILAVIGGSAVNQNDNCVPITVPNAPSQGTLYHQVAKQAGILPHQVSFIESHGTGTPVGDPIEMDSIRTVFGGSARQEHTSSRLIVSSVKGNIGHLEGASGVAGLIKAILQIEHRTAVVQASFRSLNPKIAPLGPDHITIPTSNLPLPDDFLVGCVNNYGAAGSNAAMIIMEPPPQHKTRPDSGRTAEARNQSMLESKYAILVSANSPASLQEYCRVLRDYCEQRESGVDEVRLLGSIAFHLARRQNQGLPFKFATSARDVRDLEAQLTQKLIGPISKASVDPGPSNKPPALVLVFGGQVRDHVGLSKTVWQQSALLRHHLGRCDDILRSLGYPGLHHGESEAIFQSEPISDLVVLHAAIFSVQYATARAWIDCGLAVDAVVGHSLGQLTALTVSGVLSLEDGLRFVAGRASLMKTHWGSEAGAMIAVEAGPDTLSSLPPHSLEVACYNGPSSHVLVGAEASVDDFEKIVLQRGLRFKRLRVTHGFHSKFTDPLIPQLKELASNLRFEKATIPIETCSDSLSWPEYASEKTSMAELLARHTRDPVYFGRAIQRLAKTWGACTWLEAGSDTGVTGMARRVINGSGLSLDVPGNSFLSVDLSKNTAFDAVVDTTTQLWRRGHSVQCWNVHALQRDDYEELRLPSYQWERNRHWLELRSPQPAANLSPPSLLDQKVAEPETTPPRLVRLIKHDSESAVFMIDPRCDEYKRFVTGHVVAGSPLCPATVYMEMAARACSLLLQDVSSQEQGQEQTQRQNLLLGFSNLHIDSPLGMAADRDLTLTLHSRNHQRNWQFSVCSSGRRSQNNLGVGMGVGVQPSPDVVHALGIVEAKSDAEAVDREFASYERLAGPEAVEALYASGESIKGAALLYKLFSRVVEYGAAYRGLQSVAVNLKSYRSAATAAVGSPESFSTSASIGDHGVGGGSAGSSSLTQPAILDSFMQIAGISANCVYPCPDGEVYVFTKLDRLQFGTGFSANASSSWIIHSNMTPSGGKEVSNDIFVFDAVTKRLVVLIMGARFNNVRLGSLTKVLSRVNNGTAPVLSSGAGKGPTPVPSHDRNNDNGTSHRTPSRAPKPVVEKPETLDDARASLFRDVCILFERVADVPRDSIKGNMTVEDIGIDSLMMLEVISELSNHYSIHIPIPDVEGLVNVDTLVGYLQKRGCGSRRENSTESSSVTTASSTSSTHSSGSSLEPDPMPTMSSPCTTSSSAVSTPVKSASASSQSVERLTKLLQEHLELDAPPSLDANLADSGLDSLLAIELASDIEKLFAVSVDLFQIDETSTVRDLARLAGVLDSNISISAQSSTSADQHLVTNERSSARQNPASLLPDGPKSVLPIFHPPTSITNNLHDIFEEVRLDFDSISGEEGFTNFKRIVYPEQESLVLSYTASALQEIGCDLGAIPGGQRLPDLKSSILAKHEHLLERMHKILVDGGYIDGQTLTSGYTRTAKAFDLGPPQLLLQQIVAKFPRHASEHRLLDVTGSRLADCLTGKADPLALLFANKTNRQLLADVYDVAPMCRATTRLLAKFLAESFRQGNLPEGGGDDDARFHFLEVGGGTGGTTKFLVEHLRRCGVPFTYTFTDISPALVGAAKKSLAAYADCMRYATLDVEQEQLPSTSPDFAGKFHAIISTNCIHATRNATSSLAKLRRLLRPDDGVMALVEFTEGLYWFDLVYGLLDGWWLFSDGRQHALADTSFWQRSLLDAGYQHVSWSDGSTAEATMLRLICGFNSAAAAGAPKPHPHSSPLLLSKRAGIPMETVVWKTTDEGLELSADIYYPVEDDEKETKRPVG